ncbi:ParM/StbA family protein [Microcoleus sp. FACHB-672]|uniref:ParM/StbA family protein n=1 Tax=Microcoleus sp. FACHB-672 TaxID=2692825 RepID=UPI001683BF88|nr:ParM/StbA family protein [Microcoleus sp. FACHB-672]MBD2040709.1 ParM/StbA family protein [Microcoleus sp. FACHB-672]
MNSQQNAATPMNAPKSTTTSLNNAKPTSNLINKSILSVDLGRTSTKTCVSREPDSVIFIPANIVEKPVQELRGGIFEARTTDPLLDLWVEYQGSGYALGQLAADFGANLYSSANQEKQSKTEDALPKVLTCIGYFSDKLKDKDDLSVVISLPYYAQEEFEREKEKLVNLLTGPHTMSFRGEQMSINITKVWVMPEGYGSLIWCEGESKKPATTDLSKVPVAIIDIGHQTTDCLMVDSFRFARAASKSEPFAMTEFYKQVAAQIEGSDPQSLSLIEAVNRAKGDRFYRPRGATKPTNLDDILPNLKESFSREMCARVLAWLPERVKAVILTGGGGEFFWEDMQLLLKDARIEAHLASPSRQANALGQYIYGEAQLATFPARANNKA